MKKVIALLSIVIFILFYSELAISMVVNGPRGPVKTGLLDAIFYGVIIVCALVSLFIKDKKK